MDSSWASAPPFGCFSPRLSHERRSLPLCPKEEYLVSSFPILPYAIFRPLYMDNMQVRVMRFSRQLANFFSSARQPNWNRKTSSRLTLHVLYSGCTRHNPEAHMYPCPPENADPALLGTESHYCRLFISISAPSAVGYRVVLFIAPRQVLCDWYSFAHKHSSKS